MLVYWDICELERMLSKLREEREEVMGIRDTFLNHKRNLTSVWQGEAGELTAYRLEESANRFETIIYRLESEIKILEYAIKCYRKCEEETLNMVRKTCEKMQF